MTTQRPDSGESFPSNDSPLTLPCGTIVRQRNLVVVQGRQVNSLNITIESPTPAADSRQVAREAREVAELHTAFAQAQEIRRLTVQVCRSQACLEFRERPAEMFHFVRGSDGTWIADDGQDL